MISCNIDEFYGQIENFDKVTRGKINQIVKYVANGFFQDVFKGTPILTGRARNNWIFSSGKTSRERAYRETPPKDKGLNAGLQITRGIRRAKGLYNKGEATDIYYTMTNSAPYIYKLEHGLSKTQAPQGMMMLNLQKWGNMNITHIMRGAKV